jgi:hypothetical protein
MPGTMTAEQRTAAIERAVKFYDEMLALDNGSIGHTMFGVTACNGRAALAEAQGDIDAARQWYEKAATRAGDIYPQLAEQARHRIASLDTDLADVTFPATNVSEPTVALPPVQTDPNLLQIINEGSDAEKTG